MHREQLALDQVRLRRRAQPDRDVGLAHREVELLLGRDQGEADVGIEVEELAEPRGQPMHAESRRRVDPQFPVRLLAAVGELGARRFELHQHVVRGAIEQLALLGQDEPARVAMEQRHRELLLQRADLPRHGRLREAELLTRMGEAARLGGGMKNLELVPVHFRSPGRSVRGSAHLGPRRPRPGLSCCRHPANHWPTSFHPGEARHLHAFRHSAAARRSSWAARKRSASSAAMQPRPAAVTAWR